MPIDEKTINQLAYIIREQSGKIATLEKQIVAIARAEKERSLTPKWIEDIPGRRVPYIEIVELTIAASSTSKATGTATVSGDGPFIVTHCIAFWRETSGDYQGVWGPVTAVDEEIALTLHQVGYLKIFGKPVVHDFTWEIHDSGTNRLWQSTAIASATFAPSTGHTYMLPIPNFFATNSVIRVDVTPLNAKAVSGVVQFILAGYKIVQGQEFRP